MATRVGVIEVAQSVGTESKDNLYEEIYKITKEVPR